MSYVEGLGLAKRFLLFCTGLTILEPRPNYSGMIGNGPMLTWSYLSQFVTYLTDFADLELFHDSPSDHEIHIEKF